MAHEVDGVYFHLTWWEGSTAEGKPIVRIRATRLTQLESSKHSYYRSTNEDSSQGREGLREIAKLD